MFFDQIIRLFFLFNAPYHYYRNAGVGLIRTDWLEGQNTQLKVDAWQVMNNREDLIVACAIGDLAWLKRCLKDGFRPAETNSDGVNALHSAAKHGRLECLRYLLDNTGIDVNCVVTKTGVTALQLVISQNAGTRHRCLQCVKLLLEKGANTNCQDHNGSTALHKAASIGYAQCLKVLLEAKADIRHKNKEGRTALDMAQLNGHFECARLLQALHWCSHKDQKLKEKLQLEDYLAEKELRDKTFNRFNKRHRGTKAFEQWLSIKQIPLGARQDPGACELRLDSRLSHHSTCSCEGCSFSCHSSIIANKKLTHSTKLSYSQSPNNLKSVGKPSKMYPYTNYPEKPYRAHKSSDGKFTANNRAGKKLHQLSKTFPLARVNGKVTTTECRTTPDDHVVEAISDDQSASSDNCIVVTPTINMSNSNEVQLQENISSENLKINEQEGIVNGINTLTGHIRCENGLEQSTADTGDSNDLTFHDVGPVNDLQTVSANVSSPTIIRLLQTQTLQQVTQTTAAPVRSVSHSQINHRHNAYRGKLHRRVSLGSIPEGRVVTDYSRELEDDHSLQDAIIQELLLAQQQAKENRSNFNDTTGWSSDGSGSEDAGSSSGSEANSDEGEQDWAESSYDRKNRPLRPKGALATRSTPSLSNKNLAEFQPPKRPSSVGSAKVSAKFNNTQKSSPPSLAILNLAWQPETLTRPHTPRVPKEKKPRVILWSKNIGSHQQIVGNKEDDPSPPAIPNNSPIHQGQDLTVKERPKVLTVPISVTSNDYPSPLSSKSTASLRDSSTKNTNSSGHRRAKSATLQHRNATVLKPTILKFGGELKPMYA